MLRALDNSLGKTMGIGDQELTYEDNLCPVCLDLDLHIAHPVDDTEPTIAECLECGYERVLDPPGRDAAQAQASLLSSARGGQ
jgi:Zn ribbon nucleic-acid-binding protein